MSSTIKDEIYTYLLLYLLNKSIYLKNYYFTYTCIVKFLIKISR